jgi:hypothetical protein
MGRNKKKRGEIHFRHKDNTINPKKQINLYLFLLKNIKQLTVRTMILGMIVLIFVIELAPRLCEGNNHINQKNHSSDNATQMKNGRKYLGRKYSTPTTSPKNDLSENTMGVCHTPCY